MSPEPAQPRLRILVVDDHPIVRRGLAALLDNEPWVEAVAESAGVASALSAATRQPPDAAIVDLALPDGSGLQLIPSLLRIAPAARVLVLTLNADATHAKAAIAAGAGGFLAKETNPELIVDALRTVSLGGTVLGPHLPPESVLGSAAPSTVPAPFDRLSPRELQIARLLANGSSNAAIARRLSISDKTVRNQVSNVLAAIGAADRVQAALLARDHGIV